MSPEAPKGLRFAMVIDKPGWCFDRTFIGLNRYHNTEHTWERISVSALKKGERIEGFDLVRIGGFPLFTYCLREGHLDPSQDIHVPTIASFTDLGQWSKGIRTHRGSMRALLVNDRRMVPHVAGLGVQTIYTPDYADPKIFYPVPGARPTSGPLRVGWAGSEQYWGDVKHGKEIAEALKRLSGRVTFVRQDREKDGQKSPAEMRDWFNSLDLYICANDELTCTPVPVLEAILCGVPTLTTRCGELWPMIEAIHPSLVLNGSTVEIIENQIKALLSMGGRETLAHWGRGLMTRLRTSFVSWESGEAERITRAFEALTTQSVGGDVK